jgi:AcrR family transcriptional regulator
MSDANSPDARPYHHGDLRRALVEAARRLVETEGPAAMSLRAVAREAGVSPAAPYHHFKDKGELMGAVASEGWAMLTEIIFAATAADPEEPLAPLVAYVSFARSRPALYRVMYDAARDAESMAFVDRPDEGGPYAWVHDALSRGRADATTTDIELAIAAAWCGAHGLAEMAGFRQFDRLKERLGGEAPFLKAVLSHMGLHSHGR